MDGQGASISHRKHDAQLDARPTLRCLAFTVHRHSAWTTHWSRAGSLIATRAPGREDHHRMRGKQG